MGRSSLADLGSVSGLPAPARGAGIGRSGSGAASSAGDSDEVVDGGFDLEPGPVSLPADVAQLASSADGLDPPEWFLEAFAYLLGASWPGCRVLRPLIHGSPILGVLRNVRGETEATGAGDEVAGVVGLAGSDRATSPTRLRS